MLSNAIIYCGIRIFGHDEHFARVNWVSMKLFIVKPLNKLQSLTICSVGAFNEAVGQTLNQLASLAGLAS